MAFTFGARARNEVRAAWKWCLSLTKRDWELSDYPIAIREQEIDPSYAGTRMTQHRYSASIVNWWVLRGGGDTKREALQALEKAFAATKAEKAGKSKPLPRPGVHVPIEFASRRQVDANSALAGNFIRRVLNLDWAWISDESTLWDFHHAKTNQELIARIKEVYGVRVADIESANIVQILERIAAKRQPT